MSSSPTARHAAVAHMRYELGAAIVCLVDSTTGMLLESCIGSQAGRADLDTIAVGFTDVVRSQQNLVAALGVTARVEDIMVAVGGHFHVFHVLPTDPRLFIVAVVDRETHNLALTRRLLQRLTDELLESEADLVAL